MRELQRVTGSVIKLPEHALAPPSGGDEETPVHIIGLFYSVQVSVQMRTTACSSTQANATITLITVCPATHPSHDAFDKSAANNQKTESCQRTIATTATEPSRSRVQRFPAATATVAISTTGTAAAIASSACVVGVVIVDAACTPSAAGVDGSDLTPAAAAAAIAAATWQCNCGRSSAAAAAGELTTVRRNHR